MTQGERDGYLATYWPRSVVSRGDGGVDVVVWSDAHPVTGPQHVEDCDVPYQLCVPGTSARPRCVASAAISSRIAQEDQ